MAKEMIVNPEEVRKSGKVVVPEIPINAYKLDFAAEKERYGADGLTNMLHDMMIVRVFESMLNSIKTTGGWNGVEYNHLGPAHLSIGQEAAVVGQAAELTVDDFIFGSHRSHGEILAKSFAAIRQLDKSRLDEIMTTFLGGDTLRHAEKISHTDDLDLAANFILFGTLAEIFARRDGFNRGMGGSMHAFFTPFGSMPNNAIVGGSAPIAQGSALYKRINGKPGIVVANIGDASMGCGPVWESMMFATMDQFRTLWDEEDGGNPPILFNFFNNFYGMGGQTSGETMGYDVLARVGAGINPEAAHAERVDGYDPLAVADAVRRKKELLLAGKGPVLLDTITYRISGHSPSDASSYRTKEEIDLWEQEDSIDAFAALLVKNKVLKGGDIDDMRAGIESKLTEVLKIAIDDEACPRVDAQFIESVMLSNGNQPSMDPSREPELLHPLEENPRVKAIAKKVHRQDRGRQARQQGADVPVPRRPVRGHGARLRHRPEHGGWGEENRDGVARSPSTVVSPNCCPTSGLFNSLISEAAIVGAGVGYALSGGPCGCRADVLRLPGPRR